MATTNLLAEGDLAMATGHKSWRLWLMWISLLALLILSATLYWRYSPPNEGSPAVTFARDMMAHHGQAVEMALLIRERSTDAELRQLALDIMLSQQAQIGQMQGWLAVWRLPLTGREPPMGGQGTMMGMATQQAVNSLQTLSVAEAEVLFLQLMMRHHQGGVTMASAALHQTQRPEVLRLATAIIQSQQSEIDYMQQLLAQRGAKPLPPAPMAPMVH